MITRKGSKREDDESSDPPLGPYAFRGKIPFTITFQLFGKTVNRKAKIVFWHTPEGEYYDLKTKSLQVNDAYCTAWHIEVLTVPDRSAYPVRLPRLVRMQDLIADDVLNRGVYDAILRAIDAWCANEDAERRRTAGL